MPRKWILTGAFMLLMGVAFAHEAKFPSDWSKPKQVTVYLDGKKLGEMKLVSGTIIKGNGQTIRFAPRPTIGMVMEVEKGSIEISRVGASTVTLTADRIIVQELPQ